MPGCCRQQLDEGERRISRGCLRIRQSGYFSRLQRLPSGGGSDPGSSQDDHKAEPLASFNVSNVKLQVPNKQRSLSKQHQPRNETITGHDRETKEGECTCHWSREDTQVAAECL